METVPAFNAFLALRTQGDISPISNMLTRFKRLPRYLMVVVVACLMIACTAPTSKMSPAPDSQFEGSAGTITVRDLSEVTSLCYTTDGTDPGWDNDSCNGASATFAQGPFDTFDIAISCDGATGNSVLRQVTVSYAGFTTLNESTRANYYLNCDSDGSEDNSDDGGTDNPDGGGDDNSDNGGNDNTDGGGNDNADNDGDDNTDGGDNDSNDNDNDNDNGDDGTSNPVSGSIDVRVSDDDDDAEERSNGELYLNSSDLELNDDIGESENDQIVGIRFLLNDQQIPQGSVITRAYIQFTTKRSQDNSDGSKRIKGQDSDSTERFNTDSESISSRPTTNASASWTPSEWNEDDEAGSNQRTTELKYVIQEIVDRPNWDESSLTFIITGTGTRSAWSHDGKSAFAPMLHVEFETAASDDNGNDDSGNDGDDGGSAGSGQNTLTDLPLANNEYLESTNGNYRLYLQGDGNLVLRDWATRDSLWSTGTQGTSASKLVLQNDGNLVLYTSDNSSVWASNTVGSGATILVLHDDGTLAMYQSNDRVWAVNDQGSDNDGGDDDSGDDNGNDDNSGDNSSGEVTHVGTTETYDSNGQNMTINRPSGSRSGDLLVLALHRTDDDLPLIVSGWTRAAECYKRDNGYDCVGYDDCTAWASGEICSRFGDYGRGGHDLAQSIFYKTVGSNEPSSYAFDLNLNSGGAPGWAILTALRGANNDDPVRDWDNEGCDDNPDSLFPSVYGVAGDMVLLSQSFDDAIAESKFRAPDGTTTFGYVSQSDEAGFLYGGVLTSTGETGDMKTRGDGGPSCKDALVSLTIKAE